jgi:hypothetical protein
MTEIVPHRLQPLNGRLQRETVLGNRLQAQDDGAIFDGGCRYGVDEHAALRFREQKIQE